MSHAKMAPPPQRMSTKLTKRTTTNKFIKLVEVNFLKLREVFFEDIFLQLDKQVFYKSLQILEKKSLGSVLFQHGRLGNSKHVFFLWPILCWLLKIELLQCKHNSNASIMHSAGDILPSLLITYSSIPNLLSILGHI